MKILVLEDDERRIRIFKNFLSRKHQLHIFTDVFTAIEFIKQNQVDIFFLDHDLEQCHFVDSRYKNTGAGFAREMKDLNIQPKEFVVIHSLNPFGADNICSTLLSYLEADKVRRINFTDLIESDLFIGLAKGG